MSFITCFLIKERVEASLFARGSPTSVIHISCDLPDMSANKRAVARMCRSLRT